MDVVNFSFEYYLENLNSSDSKRRLIALNHLNSFIKDYLASNNYPNNYSSFLNGIPEFVKCTIDCITSPDTKLRSASIQTLRSLFFWILLKQDHFKLSKFINLVIKYGLPEAKSLDSKSIFCISLPLLFTNENPKLSLSFNPHDLASDFEPLLRNILIVASSAQKFQEIFKQSFHALLKFIGSRAYHLVVRYWKRPSLDPLLLPAQFALLHSWTECLSLVDYEDEVEHAFSDFDDLDDSIPIDDSDTSSDSVEDFDKSIGSETGSLASSHYHISQLNVSIKLRILSFLIPETLLNNLIQKKSGNHEVENKYDPKNKHQAMEVLKETLINAFNDQEKRRQLFYSKQEGSFDFPHYTKCFSVLLSVLTDLFIDPNFNVILSALDITKLVIDNFLSERNRFFKESNISKNVRSRHQNKLLDLQSTKSITSRLNPMIYVGLNDTKLVVRVATSKLLMTLAILPHGPMILLKSVSVKLLGVEKSSNIKNNNYDVSIHSTRLRQEAVDFVTGLLLTFPSSEFDLNVIFQQVVTPGLADKKMAVRLSTLECVAVLGHILGGNNLAVLMQAVQLADQILARSSFIPRPSEVSNSKLQKQNEHGLEGGGVVISTVQARLARKQLPYIDSQGRVIPGVVAVVTDQHNSENFSLSKSFGSRSQLNSISANDNQLSRVSSTSNLTNDSPNDLFTQLDVGALMQASKDEGARRVLSTEKREIRKPLSAGKNSRLLSKLPWEPTGVASKSTMSAGTPVQQLLAHEPPPELNTFTGDHLESDNLSLASTPIETTESAQSNVSQAFRQRILLRKRKELRKFQNDVPHSTTVLVNNSPVSSEPQNAKNLSVYGAFPGAKTYPIKSTDPSFMMRKSYDSEEKLQNSLEQIPGNAFSRVKSTDCVSSPVIDLDTPLRVATNTSVGSALGHQVSSNPQTLVSCLNSLRSNDWQLIIQALQTIERMASEPHSLIMGSTSIKSQGFSSSTPHSISSAGSGLKKNPELELLNEIVLAIVMGCKNLRSQVSKQAIKTLASLFRGLPPRYMDIHCELSIRVLLGKVGEAGVAFLRDEVIQAIHWIVVTANPVRTIQALLQHGLDHKNVSIRKQCAIQVYDAVERLGVNRIFQSNSTISGGGGKELSLYSTPQHSFASSFTSGSFSISERITVAVARFLMDGSLETRLAGRKLLGLLLVHPDCDRSLRKFLTGQMLVTTLEAAEQIRKTDLAMELKYVQKLRHAVKKKLGKFITSRLIKYTLKYPANRKVYINRNAHVPL